MFDQDFAPVSGSYRPEDVTVLLKKVEIAPIDIDSKEALIQSGRAHYSSMISEERRPDARYMDIFQDAWLRGIDTIAVQVASLAKTLQQDVKSGLLPAQLTLCSLVRAGLPYGVLLHRELKAIGVDSVHYGVSIIRDKGLDANAMRRATEDRPAEGVIFVDGWTGKGAIFRELEKSWSELCGLAPNFLVLADPSGFATYSGSHEDWLIPSGILGANVSGLISRSILNDDLIGPADYHGYIPVDHLADIDVTLAFVDSITARCAVLRDEAVVYRPDAVFRASLNMSALRAVDRVALEYGVTNLNRIKPGIAEATRAVLRRKPKMVFLRSSSDPDLAALIHLCHVDSIPTRVAPDLTGPYRAITLIEKVS